MIPMVTYAFTSAGTLNADVHHAAFATGSLGGEDHQVRLQRFIGAGQDRARVVVGQRCDKVAHDSEVAAAVTALDRTVGANLDSDSFGCVRQEVEDLDQLAVAIDFPACAKDARLTVALPGERRHREGGGAAV